MKLPLNEQEHVYPARREITLRDCVFICCLPLKQDSFERAWAISEYCGRFNSWAEYCTVLDVNRRFEQLAALSELGLRGTESSTFEEFSKAIRDRPPLVAVLGHCRQRREIEFAEGFVSLTLLASAIPRDFDGVLDVSVCNPQGFLQLAKARASSSLIRTAKTVLSGGNYLLFYVTLFLAIAKLGQYGSSLIYTIDLFSKARASAKGDPTW
jgi:hypothetical protein